MIAPRANLAVVSRRSEPADSLDYFPTPPWATRALMESEAVPSRERRSVHEPCCGEGHMAATLAEYFEEVVASDVFPYGYGTVADYLAPDAEPVHAQWVITNPPFNAAPSVLKRALDEAGCGVALLLRSVWMHGDRRWREIFSRTPPVFVMAFAERVPMAKGRWDPELSTATDYSWFVWQTRSRTSIGTALRWIPPGRRQALTRPDDYDRFAAARPAPLLDAMEPAS